MVERCEFDTELIRRYDTAGPRYTSYPTAVQFHEGFGAQRYRTVAKTSNDYPIPNPLSLYVHIPFCDTICYYCACNKVITRNRSRAIPYLEALHREIAAQGALFDDDRLVSQVHWGGGSPTFLNHEQMAELMTVCARHYNLRDDDEGEYSIEIDPRQMKANTVSVLRQIGFNRMSLGVQDFDSRVQAAVNRIQSEEETLAVMNTARACGFKSISVDLIYGLPLQTLESFARTLDRIVSADPDRISVFNYAHLPERFKTQRQITAADLPQAAEKLAILRMTIERLTTAGYVYIGMDHFAKPADELARAQRQGTLYRNFQGYSTHSNCDLIGLGITAIGKVGDSYSQNVRTLEAYYECIGADELAVFRGLELSPDDQLRREVITQLMCNFQLRICDIERRFNIDFGAYFAPELASLRPMEDDDLLRVVGGRIRVRPLGRLLIRNICMVFDAYGREVPRAKSYSRVI